MNSPKSIVIGIAAGLTIAIWSFAYIVIKQFPQDNSQQNTSEQNKSKSEQENSTKEPKFFSARLGGIILLTKSSAAPNVTSSMLYLYQSVLGKTLAPVNLVMFVQVTNLKPILTQISRYKSRVLIEYSVKGKAVEEWRQLYSLELLNNEVFYIQNDNWKNCTRFDFSNESFDLNARQNQLQPGQTVSGYMLYEIDPEIIADKANLKEIELTIEDVVGDTQTFNLTPIDNSKGVETLINPGTFGLQGGFDLTKEQYYLKSQNKLRKETRQKEEDLNK